MRRGDLYLADLEPVRGSEADKNRPVVIVTNDAANERAEQLGRGVVTVVPLTSNVARLFPFQVFLPARKTGLSRNSKAQAEQVRAVDVERLGALLGTVPPALMEAIDDALRTHLAL